MLTHSMIPRWLLAAAFALVSLPACNTPSVVDLGFCSPTDPPLICQCNDGRLGEAECRADGEVGDCVCPIVDAGTDGGNPESGSADAGTPEADGG